MSEFYMSPLVVDEKGNAETMARIWNAALPEKFRATPRFFEYNLLPCEGGVQGGTWMIHAGRQVGFVLASLLPNNERVTPRPASPRIFTDTRFPIPRMRLQRRSRN